MVGKVCEFWIRNYMERKGLVNIKALSSVKWRIISIRIAGIWDKTFYMVLIRHLLTGYGSFLSDIIHYLNNKDVRTFWGNFRLHLPESYSVGTDLSSSNHHDQNSLSSPVVKKSTIQLELNYSNTRLSPNLIYRYLIHELQHFTN